MKQAKSNKPRKRILDSTGAWRDIYKKDFQDYLGQGKKSEINH